MLSDQYSSSKHMPILGRWEMNTEAHHRESQRHANNSGAAKSMMSMGNLYTTHARASLAERASLLRPGAGTASHYDAGLTWNSQSCCHCLLELGLSARATTSSLVYILSLRTGLSFFLFLFSVRARLLKSQTLTYLRN